MRFPGGGTFTGFIEQPDIVYTNSMPGKAHDKTPSSGRVVTLRAKNSGR